MNQELTVIEIPEFLPVTKSSGIEKAEIYAATFAPFMITLKELSNKTAGINKDTPSAVDAKLAREVRLALVKNRTATAKKKDESKAALLAESNLIQNLHNVVINTSQLIEADMEAIEKYAENKEKERIEALRLDRVNQLSPYVEGANIYPLGTLSDDAFTELLTGSKLAYDAKKEAARLAEENRIKEENVRLEEQKRIREENERLKAEAEEKEKAIQAERKAAADKLAAIEESNRIAREKAVQEQAVKDKAAAEAVAKAQAELKAKLEAEKKEADRIAKIESDRIAAEKKAAKAPVKDKLRLAINAMVCELPDSEISADITAKFNGFKSWALTQIESL